MNNQKYSALLVLLLATVAGAQITAAPGDSPSAVPGSEEGATNVISGGLRVSTYFDDNASNNLDERSNVATFLEPHLSWQMTRNRMKWSLDYQPSFSWSYQLSHYGSRTQAGDAKFEYQLSKRLLINVRDSYDVTTNTFDRLSKQEFAPNFNIFDRPNDSLLLPATRRTTELGAVDVIYQLARHTVTGVSGTFSQLRYRSLDVGQGLSVEPVGTTSVGGRAFATQHISPRTWAGLEYNFDDFNSPNRKTRSRVHNILYTHSLIFSRKMALSLFAGPEYSHDHDVFLLFLPPLLLSVPENHNHWSWAAGGTFSWAGDLTSVNLSASRQISDGAGLAVALRLERVGVEVQRKLTRRWTGRLTADYDRNQLLETSAGTGSLNYFSGSCGLTRDLMKDLSLDLRYWRTQQTFTGTTFSGLPLSHNRASVSLNYTFSHVLGR